MSNLDIMKMASDIMLLLSLVWLSFRFVRTPGTGAWNSRMADLESSIRSLIREADEAGRSLGDQLARRQRELEKALYDAETIEGRINKAIIGAEDRKGQLDIQIGKAETAQHGLESAISRSETAAASRPLAKSIQVERQAPPEPQPIIMETVEEPAEEIDSPPIYEEEEFIGQPPYQELQPAELAPEPPSFEIAVQRNPARETATQRAAGKATPLTAQVEKEVEQESAPTPAVRRQRLRSSMHSIYQAAEQSARVTEEIKPKPALDEQDFGVQDPVSISDRPLEVISTAPQQPGRDPRLGVLGGIKRQVQIL